MLSTQHVFEVPYVEKYRPVTLEDVVGKLYFTSNLARKHGCRRSTKVYCKIWKHAKPDTSGK